MAFFSLFVVVVASGLLWLWGYDAGKKAGQRQAEKELVDPADWWKE